MSQEKQVPSDVMMNSIVTSVQKQDQRIKIQEEKLTRMEEKIDGAADNLKGWEAAKAAILQMIAVGKDQKILMEKLSQFFRSLDIAVDVLRHPPESKVQHHHHITKIAWIAAGLFLILCLVCSGWYMTAQKIDQYKAGDVKYRSLKLIPDTPFHQALVRLDSVFLADPDSIERRVIRQEELNQKSLELTDQLQAVNREIGQDKKTGQTPKKGR